MTIKVLRYNCIFILAVAIFLSSCQLTTTGEKKSVLDESLSTEEQAQSLKKDVTEDHPLVPLTLYNKYKGMCEPLLFKHTNDNFIGVISSISICLFIIIYQPIKEDFLYDSLVASITYYEWEYDYEISNDDILFYLIDNTSIEDYDNVINNELIEIVDKLNLGS